MNPRNRLPLLLTALVICFHCLPMAAQKLGRSDSLNRVLQQKDLSPKDRIVTMGLLGESKAFTDVPGGIRIEREALKRCAQLNDPEVTAPIYAFLSMLSFYRSDMESAGHALDSALLYADQSRSKKTLGLVWCRKAWLEDMQAKLNDAVKSALQSLKYLEGTDGYMYQASAYYILSSIHAEWGDLPLQKEYAQLSLAAALKSGHLDRIMFGYQKVANYYQFAYKKHRDDHSLLDSALVNNRKGIRFFLAHKPQIIYQSYLATIAFSVASLYQRDYIGNYNKDSLAYYLDMALRASIETRQTGTTALCYAIMSDDEIAEGHFQKGESLLLTALSVVRSDSIPYPRNEIQIMRGLADVAEQSGAYDRALKYHREYFALYEAFYNAEKQALSKDLEAKYQSEKAKDALAELTRTAALNRKLTYLYIALFIALGIALVFIIRSLRFRLKATTQQKKLLEANALRMEAEQQLLQERQERLQKDLLAGSLQMEQKDEILQAVQKKIEESDNEQIALKQINKIIDQNKKVDENFASYKADFDNIRPEFFEKLREKSGNTLSRLEMKHCAYISMGLTNKEVAQRLGVAPKTVVMTRYRIKIKLGLAKEENIDEYIVALR